MSAFKDIMSIIDPTAAKTTPAPSAKQSQPAIGPKPAPRPSGAANGTSHATQLKRKASGSVDGSQVKIQRKDAAGQTAQANGSARPTPTPIVAKANTPVRSSSVPYRGTAGLGSTNTATTTGKKPIPLGKPSSTTPKAAAPAPKSPGAPAGTATSAPTPAKKGGYLAMLQKAKEKDQSKPAAPPVKHETTKILTKKERLALRAEASAGAKGKKPVPGMTTKAADPKSEASKEKRKPAELGYQGTARPPPKKPVDLGYKGTARPNSTAPSASRNGANAQKQKPKPAQRKYDGYADWSDLDAEDLEDEEDYESDASSDMEGGMWDVEQEEAMALKAAKREDAEALAEENELKRQKEERKRKLLAMQKAAAAKRRY